MTVITIEPKVAELIAYTGKGIPTPVRYEVHSPHFLHRVDQYAKLMKRITDLVDRGIPFEVRFE